jgi:hypothetical protein
MSCTDELLARDLFGGTLDRFDLDAITDLALADEATRWLSLRIDALVAEREDEKAFPVHDRDHEWLGASKAALKRARRLLHEVAQKALAFKRAAGQARDVAAERVFVEVVREKVERVEWLAFWDEVYRRRPDLKVAA